MTKIVNDNIKFIYFGSAFGGGIPVLGIDLALFSKAIDERLPMSVVLNLQNWSKPEINGTYTVYPTALDKQLLIEGRNGTRKVTYIRLHDFLALADKIN